MAITRRNYTPGQYETFTNESIGTPVLNAWTTFSLDGLFSFDVANDVILYQGGSPVPSSAYELRTDNTYTAREASYSGETLVNMFRITNATYAGVATTASGKNFGSAVDNDLLYTLYQASLVYSRTDYTTSDSFTTSTTLFRSLHVFDSLTADATFTITDGGGDERNKFTVKNADSTYKVIVTDGTYTYWVTPEQSVDFYENSGLVWASAGWETVFKDMSNTSDVSAAMGNIGSVSVGDIYFLGTATTSNYLSDSIIVQATGAINHGGTFTSSTDAYYRWNGTLGTPAFQIVGLSGVYVGEIRRWHEAQ